MTDPLDSYQEAAEQREGADAWLGDPRDEHEAELTECAECGHLHFNPSTLEYERCPLAPECDCRGQGDDATETDEAGQIRLGHEGEQRGFPGLSQGPEPAPTLDSARRVCAVCGATLTDSEERALARDTDFVEHGDHLIRAVNRG